MTEMTQTLGDVISKIETLPWNHALFLPEEKPWHSDTPCLILDPNDSDDPEEDPDAAKQQGLRYALDVGTVQDIVANATEQSPDIDVSRLIDAFNHYYENDAFIEF